MVLKIKMFLYAESPGISSIMATGCIMGCEVGGLIGTLAYIENGTDSLECMGWTIGSMFMGGFTGSYASYMAHEMDKLMNT